MARKLATWIDEDGRRWRTELPDDVSDDEAEAGKPIGPISLAPLALPKDVEVRLHNELYARGLFTLRDLRRDRTGLHAAIQAAIQLDAERILGLYRVEESEVTDARTRESAEGEPDTSIHVRGSRGPGRRAGVPRSSAGRRP